MNHYSLKRIQQLNEEAPIRRELAKRAGGIPVESVQTVYHNSTKYTITRVMCLGGRCECGCGLRTSNPLDPHHKIKRSGGGDFTLENIIMVMRGHHKNYHGQVQLNWIKPTNPVLKGGE